MSEKMEIQVLCFARAKDLAGRDRLEVMLAPGSTVGELRRLLARLYPALAALLEKSAFAVNGEFADEQTRIPAYAEVALLPPVSGG
jgi:molybdopterin converting factor subunit 1